jgi:8-oxo-dGTP diphosphatase
MSAVSVAGIARENGKLFVARRKSGGDLGGKWEFPGGKAEDGESAEEALIREYKEEFSVPVRVGRLLGSAAFEHRGAERILKAYAIFFINKNFKMSEHTKWRWAAIEEIKNMDFADSDRKLFRFLELDLQS